jgi:hypothetical protein
MNTSFPRSLCVATVLVICLCGWVSQSEAQVTGLVDPSNWETRQLTKEDGWIVQRDEQARLTVRTKELTLYPKAEPRPALKYRLIPDDFDMLGGNAAIYYLKALGFLEQSHFRRRLDQVHKEASARAKKEGKEYNEVPPTVWLSTPPMELPLDEVKEYLRLTSFQREFIREAAQRDRFDVDRNLREVDDLIAYHLSEIQSMRELGRTQSLRCRVAIAEGRIDDAIAITGQQFAMARHLGQDEFLVSNLVGMAIAGIAWDDALYLIQRPETPNLYWAFATMPAPLVDLRHSMATERQFLYLQLKVLREVDETRRPAGYWRDFIDRLLPQIGYLGSELNLPSVSDAKLARAGIVGFIAAAYPGAKEYLLAECTLPPQQVEAYPTAQVVFLATVRFYDQWRDAYFKWTHLPFWQVRTMTEREQLDDAMRLASKRYGWCTTPANVFLRALRAVRIAAARCDQCIALIQTVEAIRMYAAAHDGKLPPSLDKLPVPAPIEPFTGKPIEYQFLGNRAVLNGHSMPGMRYRLVLRFAKESKSK